MGGVELGVDSEEDFDRGLRELSKQFVATYPTLFHNLVLKYCSASRSVLKKADDLIVKPFPTDGSEIFDMAGMEAFLKPPNSRAQQDPEHFITDDKNQQTTMCLCLQQLIGRAWKACVATNGDVRLLKLRRPVAGGTVAGGGAGTVTTKGFQGKRMKSFTFTDQTRFKLHAESMVEAFVGARSRLQLAFVEVHGAPSPSAAGEAGPYVPAARASEERFGGTTEELLGLA